MARIFGGRNFRKPKISVAGSAVGEKYGGEMRHAGHTGFFSQ